MHVDQVWRSDLLDSTPGTAQTLAGMADFVRRDSADLQLRRFALGLVSSCPGHNFHCEIDKVFRFVRDRIRYRKDPVAVELVQDARRTIDFYGSGDCDCKVVCLATLLACLGHRSRFKVLGPSRSNYTHVYLEVYTRNCNCGDCERRAGWMPLDPTPEHAPAGWEARGMPTETYDIWPETIDTIGPALFITGGFLLWWLLR